MVLEDLEIAKARGARVYAEVVGYGSAGDAWDLIQPVEKGDGTRRAMEFALYRHDVPRDQIDLINPHGTSTPLGDLREAQAIHSVFGDRATEIAISGTKSMTGHLMGAAGAVEGIFTVLSVFHQIAPATINYREPDPEIRARRGPRRLTADGDPIRHVGQHRPRRPQRRGHLQALRRRLTWRSRASRYEARITTESIRRRARRPTGAARHFVGAVVDLRPMCASGDGRRPARATGALRPSALCRLDAPVIAAGSPLRRLSARRLLAPRAVSYSRRKRTCSDWAARSMIHTSAYRMCCRPWHQAG